MSERGGISTLLMTCTTPFLLSVSGITIEAVSMEYPKLPSEPYHKNKTAALFTLFRSYFVFLYLKLDTYFSVIRRLFISAINYNLLFHIAAFSYFRNV